MRSLFLMPFFAGFLCCCSSQPSVEKQESSNTMLWEISGNGLSKPSYFFGTMHVLCSEDAKISSNFQKVINSVGQVYFEIDMDDLSQMFGSLGSLAMKDGKSLKDFYNEKDYERIKSWFSKNGQLPFNMLEHYKPMLLSSMISEKAMACAQKDGMELQIMQLVSKKKLEIKGLETMAYQAGILDSIPYEEQAKDLLQAIDSAEVQDVMVKKLVQQYKLQNMDSLEVLTKSEGGTVDKYIDIMLYNRNRNWVKQFDNIAKEKSTLFAVGAGHLPGNQGVLNLLRKKGYTITPLKNH